MKRYYPLLIALIGLFLSPLSKAQNNQYVSINDAIESPENVRYLLVPGDSASISLLLTHSKSFRNIAGIAIQDEVQMENELWESFLQFRLLEHIVLDNNNLTRLEISSSTTVNQIWISGSPKLTYNNLEGVLSKCRFIKVLKLHDFKINNVPPSLSQLSLLKSLQMVNSKWTFEDIVESVEELPELKTLILAHNQFGEVGRSVKKLSHVEHLDLSGNNLFSIHQKVNKLEHLDTLVLNQNLFDDLVPIAERLQGSSIDLLVFQNDTINANTDIDYLLPGKEVIWTYDNFNDLSFTLPTVNNEVQDQFEVDELNQESLNADAAINYGIRPYSPAFIRYDQLQFPQPLANLDTSCFISRYQDSTYVYTAKVHNQNETPDGYYYPLKLDKAHGTYYKKKRKRKIKHKKQSHIRLHVQKPPKDHENEVYISVIPQPVDDIKRTDLSAYRDIVWRIEGFTSKKSFEEAVTKNRTWSDIRIIFDEETEMFELLLKGRFGEMTLKAKPFNASYKPDKKFYTRTVPKMNERYQKNLDKSKKKFDKTLTRDIAKAERKFRKEIDRKWNEVQTYMSEEEKKLSRREWMPYYQKIKGKEYVAIGKERLEILYLTRFLESRGFEASKGNDFYVGQKWIDFHLFNAQNDTLEVLDYCVVDLDQRLVRYFPNRKNNQILFDGYHRLVLLARLSNGQFVFLNNDQIVKINEQGFVTVGSQNYIPSGITNKSFSLRIEKLAQALVY